MPIMIIIYILNILVIQHIGLSADGAHYALYAKHLSWGYVDHPPLIGWLQALALFCFGNHGWTLHLVPLLFSFSSLVLLAYFSHDFMPKNGVTAFCFMAVVWNALTFLAITQAPLIFFSLLSCYLFYRWINASTILNGLMLGVSLGLAGLADYSAFLVAAGFFIYLGIYQPRKLLAPSLVLSCLLALILISPFLWWNAQHHWVSFCSGYNHSFSGSFSWHWFSQAIAIQLLGYSPALVIFGLIGGVQAIRSKNMPAMILAIPGLVVIAVITLAGMHHKIFFHWPALGWILLAPLAYKAIVDYWSRAWTKIVVTFSLLLTLIVTIAFYTQVFFAPLSFPLGKNPLIDLYGWQQIGNEAKVLAIKNNPKQKPILFVENWSLASRLAWYSDLPVQILQPSPIAGYKQFVLWYGKPSANAQGILVVPHKWKKPAVNSNAANTFKHCNLLNTLAIKNHNHLVNQVNFYQCTAYIQ
jgi:4-amino-4-deoxy-L-arabinose transferase-like glycosyltransferase